MTSSGGAGPAGGARSGLPAGASLVELTLALGIVSLGAAMSAPLLAGVADASRAREAAQFLAAECRGARVEAVARNATASLVFDRGAGGWLFRRCIDGNGNGMRRAEIVNGRDTCADSLELDSLFSGVRVDVLPGLPDPDAGPRTTDAVRFGASGIASFTAAGTATAGTVYLRSVGGAQYAIRVAGTTGRVRVLRFDPTAGAWSEI